MNEGMNEGFSNNDLSEHFFPMINMNHEMIYNKPSNKKNQPKQQFNNVVRKQNPQFNPKQQPYPLYKKNKLNKSCPRKLCMDNYVPQYQSLSNVCSPVATFKNELNTQGLNHPSGFNSPSVGSPLR